MNRLLQRTNKCVWMFGAGLVLAAGTVFAAISARLSFHGTEKS